MSELKKWLDVVMPIYGGESEASYAQIVSAAKEWLEHLKANRTGIVHAEAVLRDVLAGKGPK